MTLSALLRVAGLAAFAVALLVLSPVMGAIGWATPLFLTVLGLALWLLSLVVADFRSDRNL